MLTKAPNEITVCSLEVVVAAPQTATERHLDMLQADRLRAWAFNIEQSGANIAMWGDPTFVAAEARRIANDIESQVHADNAAPVVPRAAPTE